MPYIRPDFRKQIDPYLNQFLDDFPTADVSGDLNYVITRIIHHALDIMKKSNNGEIRYAHLNNLMGVLESAKLEFYRRRVVPFEDQAIIKNGDV
jgi:hypothetical protein